MKRTKFLLSVLLATIFLAAQVMVVGAAPATQDTTPITGTIESIVLETDTNTVTTTVVVTLTDEFGETQTLRLSVEDATALGLVTDDGSGPVVDDGKVGTEVEIDPATVIPDETEETMDEAQHPVGSALSNFFSDVLGVDYEMIMDYHDDGVGFGVIAQALWMTNALDGDTETFAAILDAKQNKDFSGIKLPDGSIPTNWGQFRKAVMKDRDKSKENLGAVMSGRAESQMADDEPTEPMSFNQNGNKDKNNDKGNSADKSNNGKSDDKKANGKEKNKDKGNGKGKNK